MRQSITAQAPDIASSDGGDTGSCAMSEFLDSLRSFSAAEAGDDSRHRRSEIVADATAYVRNLLKIASGIDRTISMMGRQNQGK